MTENTNTYYLIYRVFVCFLFTPVFDLISCLYFLSDLFYWAQDFLDTTEPLIFFIAHLKDVRLDFYQ